MVKQEYVTVTARIPKTLHKQLQKTAILENRTMSATIKCAITNYCKKQDGNKNE